MGLGEIMIERMLKIILFPIAIIYIMWCIHKLAKRLEKEKRA